MDSQSAYLFYVILFGNFLTGIWLIRKTREDIKKDLIASGMSEKWAEMKSAVNPKIIGGMMIALSVITLLSQLSPR